jgi:hypothetical protein
MGYLIMSKKEREQAKVFEQLKEAKISQIEAAARLKITPRWVRYKFKRYLERGDSGLVHKGRGRPSPKQWDKKEKEFLLNLLQGEWADFGPTFAAEKLEEIYGIKVDKETVRQSMIRANLWKPKEKRVKHRARRERKPMLGVMVQVDGSPHDWFEGRAGKCTLLVFIDDATSKILWLAFVPSESVMALLQATKDYLEKHGIPLSFYVDHGSVFHVNLNNAEGDKKTQWEKACAEVGIVIHHANSPQAKGRVERCNGTMQDRLIKEMRLKGISSIEAANEYIRTGAFIEQHNTKFAVKPAQEGNAHRAIGEHNLEQVFSIKETRILANDYTITYEKRIFQLHRQQGTILRPKNEITVRTSLTGKITLLVRKTELDFNEISTKPIKIIKEKKYNNQPRKPSENSRRWAGGLTSMSRDEAGLPAVEANVKNRNFLPRSKPEFFTSP